MASENICKVSKKCGGCQYQGVEYNVQLDKKNKEMKKLLGSYAKVEPIIGMENPCYYRNKVHAVFDRDKKGNVICGTYEEGTHKVVAVEECFIEDKLSQDIIRTIRDLCKSFKIRIYDEDSRQGLLRHVLVRRGFTTGEVMVVLVLSSIIMPSKNNFVKTLRKIHPEITTVVLNVNDKKTSMVLGDREEVIYGSGYIKDVLCGITFRLSAKSFYQVNPVQTEILYNKAIEYAGLGGRETVIDAYCGIGTIGMVAAKKAKKVIGIELNPAAVKDARINAKNNKLSNIQFYQGDAGDFMVNMVAKGEKADVLFMDPPRSGSDEKFLKSAITLAPKKIVYISCGPDTLARDLKYLTKKEYKVEKIQPVDMFPWTAHVETVVLLSKLGSAKHHIEVELKMSDLDLTSAESKATYAEIVDYVYEQTGLKVSSLYIAQVKEKCGLEKRENHRLPESEPARQPQCPKEKEEAIVEALKHFKMI